MTINDQQLDDRAVQVLSISGAMCGVCGDEPGDHNCADCERVRRGYIRDLRAAGWAPQEEHEALVAEVRRLHADAADVLLPDWEAMYEPGNVSNYLIGYANDEAAAKGAAEAWLRSQAEVTGRLEWQPWGTVTDLPDGYDAWFELAERHDDGIDTGPGIVVRRRTPAARSAAA